MFTDMVGSTEMTAQLGDTMAVELLRAHDAIIRRCLEHHRGSEVKHLGDGIMASFVDVPASVACAIEIQEELASYNEISETPIRKDRYTCRRTRRGKQRSFWFGGANGGANL